MLRDKKNNKTKHRITKVKQITTTYLSVVFIKDVVFKALANSVTICGKIWIQWTALTRKLPILSPVEF